MIDDPLRVDGGLLSGVGQADGSVRSYRGIPFAAPPLGDLRWRPPQPVRPWHGVRVAHAFAPQCPQPARAPDSLYAEYAGMQDMNEDCLYLNVWTAATTPAERLPVMVWFHGGGFRQGSGANPVFACGDLPQRGVVLVTFNYRLGVLGFLAHPALTAESPHAASGNYGLLDMVAALRWVRRNIGAFGGDSRNVTAFGSSSGAQGIAALMASERAGDLFDRAVLHSSGPAAMRSLDEAARDGGAFARRLGAATPARLRRTPVSDLLAASLGKRLPFAPVVDGWLLPRPVQAVFAAGQQRRLQLLAGWTSEEGALYPPVESAAAFEALLRRRFGARAAAAARLYPAADDSQARSAGVALNGDVLHAAEVYTAARAHAATGAAVHLFHFAHPQPFFTGQRFAESPRPDEVGAFHSSDYPYVFGSLDALQRAWTRDDRRLSALMQACWTQFARTGNPNAPGLPTWPAFDENRPTVLHLASEPRLVVVPRIEQLRFLTGAPGWDRAGVGHRMRSC